MSSCGKLIVLSVFAGAVQRLSRGAGSCRSLNERTSSMPSHTGSASLTDVFIPTGNKNGLGIVDVISGVW